MDTVPHLISLIHVDVRFPRLSYCLFIWLDVYRQNITGNVLLAC
jgi:hypothetical protein